MAKGVSDTLKRSQSLLQRAKAGDQEALEELLRLYRPTLIKWSRRFLPAWASSAAGHEDIVQDVLLDALKQIRRFEGDDDASFLVYLRRNLNNRIRDELARASKASFQGLRSIDNEPAPGPSALDLAIGHEAVSLYEEALSRLSDRDQSLIVTRVELGMSYNEIAEMLDRPMSAVRVSIHRALVRLATEMSRVS